MLVRAAVARGVHDPAHQDGEQDHGDESSGERPEHDGNDT
jgi:hypothetical protein